MKIEHRGLSVERSLGSTDRIEGKKPLLEVGKRIASEIISVEGDEVLLKLGSSLIKARNMSSDALFSGMMAEFEVLRSDRALIEIRPVALSALSGEVADTSHLQKLARELGVIDSVENLRLLSKMMKLDFPVSKANFEGLKLLELQTAKIREAILSSGLSEDHTQEARPLSSPQLFDIITAAPKEIALKQDLLSLLQSLVSLEYLGSEETGLQPSLGELSQSESLNVGAELAEADFSSTIEGRPTLDEASSPEVEVLKQEGITEKKEELDLNLMKNIVREYRTLAADENQFLNALVSLSKQGVKPSILNMVLLNSQMKGSLGLGEAVFELEAEVLDKMEPELKAVVEHFKSKLLNFGALEEVDADSLEEMVKIYEDMMTKLEEGAKQAKLPREANILGEQASLTKEMQPTWQALIMPMLNGQKLEDLEIYVKKEGAFKSGDGSRPDKLVYLSLKTDNMDRVKIKIDYGIKNIKLSFFTKSKEAEKHLRAELPRLEEGLRQLSDKALSLHVNSEEGDRNLVDFELLSAKAPSKIDVRI